eukprot:scaffold196694_cov31-Tisochrysis_lutea.AAC.2
MDRSAVRSFKATEREEEEAVTEKNGGRITPHGFVRSFKRMAQPMVPSAYQQASAHAIAAAAQAAQQALQAAWPGAATSPAASSSAVAIAATAAAATAMGVAASFHPQQQHGWMPPMLPSGTELVSFQSPADVGTTNVTDGEALQKAEAARQSAVEAAAAAEAALKELQWKHEALLEKYEAVQAQLDALSKKHKKLEEGYNEIQVREAEYNAEARAEKRAGEVKDAFISHLKQQNEEWRSHSIAVLELKKEKEKKEKGDR